ncbi:MAG: GspE/PulE family protein [Planctomycetota bacterium]|jgi:general secretion pathway protein E
MQILDFIRNILPTPLYLSSSQDSLAAETLLPFNPTKLVFFIIWFYLCLYFIQRIQFSPLVPKKYKSISYVISLVAGPIVFLVLLIVDTAKNASKSNISLFEAISEQLRSIIDNLRSIKPGLGKQSSDIKLLDSSGRSIKEIYGHSSDKRKDSHILDLTEQVIARALDHRASDILIDPTSDTMYKIRFRVDGVLRTEKEIKSETCKAVINSIKAVSSMDISERRRPQDGAFMAKKGEINASFRVASAGVLNGEKLSIRVLNQQASNFILPDMGLVEKQYSIIQSAVNKPSGMILICGPTGSGKTTTMYAMLNEMDRYTRNVITVEDPIEAMLPETSQIEINPKADITFAKALRSILRQDPDVICVGEIRDEETAEIALRAAQTGHLVLATIHCQSNAAALIRLLDLGVSPILLSTGLSLVISQRLVRRLCEHCKGPAELTESLMRELQSKHVEYTNMFDAIGCRRCNETGYLGRMAVLDLMPVTDELKANIADNKAIIDELKSKGDKKTRTNLRKEGLKKVSSGITSLEELKRVIG